MPETCMLLLLWAKNTVFAMGTLSTEQAPHLYEAMPCPRMLLPKQA